MQEKNSNSVNSDISKRSIFLHKVPQRPSNLRRLIAHYKKFGHIDAIYTSGQYASIIFEHEESAKAAVESPMTVLHNRFIIVGHQSPDKNPLADLSASCRMDLVRSETKEALKNMKKEAEETAELRSKLLRTYEERKTSKAIKILDENKKEFKKAVDELDQRLMRISELPKEEKEIEQTKIDALSEKIRRMEQTNDDLEYFLNTRREANK